MKLILFIIAMINTSWQQESTETLNETLDRLIKQANVGDHSKTNITTIPNSKKTSRIIYFNPDSKTKSDIEAKLNGSIHNTGADSQLSIVNILHALGLKTEDENRKESDKPNIVADSPNVDEDKVSSSTDNTYDAELQGLLDQLILKTKNIGQPGDSSDIPSSFTADTGNDFLHNYPEIIIDKITYHDHNNEYSETKPKGSQEGSGVTSTVTENQYKHKKDSTDKLNNSVKVAQDLKALLEELRKLKATETATNYEQSSNFPSPAVQIQDSQEGKQPCENMPMSYASLCRAALLDKMEYQGSRSNDPDSNTNLHLNVWGPQNARQIGLITIARAQKLKRIRFITQLINNMMSKFVYRPLYGFY